MIKVYYDETPLYYLFPEQDDVIEQIEIVHDIVKDINSVEQIKEAMNKHKDLYMVFVNNQFVEDYDGKPIRTIKYFYDDISVYYDIRDGKVIRNSMGEIHFSIEENEDNTNNESKMYNENIKNEFLEHVNKFELKDFENLFIECEKYEKEYEKDIYDFTVNEIDRMFIELKVIDENMKVLAPKTMRAFSNYVQFRESHKGDKSKSTIDLTTLFDSESK